MIGSVGAKVGFTNTLKEQDKQIKNQKVENTQIKEDKVSAISQSLKNGTYKINLNATAEKMALNLLNL
ncbi:flagellar biosynthesis protein FlgM [Helicobacter anseris]|uniref:Flagellar biosynthesis protein FlgM n=1 Tax=Helicobacter anseris TaxID=375926 RepID=A0A3D8JBX7_9HELI|nr:flagellar biosynthesis anti-sigma factor FlgM [Helicobacter anseris]RDU74675.1 flagellar biosynthesis protein FlgM [Helicobacter anseris]